MDIINRKRHVHGRTQHLLGHISSPSAPAAHYSGPSSSHVRDEHPSATDTSHPQPLHKATIGPYPPHYPTEAHTPIPSGPQLAVPPESLSLPGNPRWPCGTGGSAVADPGRGISPPSLGLFVKPTQWELISPHDRRSAKGHLHADDSEVIDGIRNPLPAPRKERPVGWSFRRISKNWGISFGGEEKPELNAEIIY